MQPSDIIKSSIAYIERNLKTDITANELADMAGYSVWHYQRLFAQATGMPIAAFINKRRLDKALGEIAGGRRAVDVALEYGFDTYAGFYKAFVRMYGISPKKTILKTEVSVMYTEKELRDILANWDIPQDLPILDVYIADGTQISGNVWSVGEDYILKAGERDRILRNLNIAKALAGFAAAVPVKTKSGAEYLDGNKITVLAQGIKGTPLAKTDRFGDSRREFGVKYGIGIAKLHNALAAIEADIKPREFDLFAAISDWALPEVKKQNIKYQLGLPDDFIGDYLNGFESIFQKLPKQLIHRDPNPSNIMLSHGEVSGFIDFDISERNIRLWDPCYCATGILSEWRGVDGIYEKWPDILSGILDGYNRVNPLTEEEKQSVYYVICSISMIFLAYCESRSELGALAATNREMLQYIAQNEGILRNII